MSSVVANAKPPETMRAIVMRTFGPPEVLQVEDVPTPALGEGQVLFRVHAVSVNRTLDIFVRRDGNNRGVTLPHVLGVDPSGVVEAVGPGVETPVVGERVGVVNLRCGTCRYCSSGQEEDCRSELHLGIRQWGGYAEYVRVHAAATVALPAGLAFAQATVILRHFPTAFALARRGGLPAHRADRPRSPTPPGCRSPPLSRAGPRARQSHSQPNNEVRRCGLKRFEYLKNRVVGRALDLQAIFLESISRSRRRR